MNLKADFPKQLQLCADEYMRKNGILNTKENRDLVISIMYKASEFTLTYLQRMT